MQQSKPSRSCVFVLQCLRFRVLKLCAICFIKLSSSFLNNGRLCPTRLAAMPRRPVTHAASDLEALAAQSASDYEEALRGKAGEESTCVTCRRAAFELARTHCAFVMNICAARYEGVRRANGTLEEKADAAVLANLVFTWTIRRGSQEACHESQVRCDNAWERGVPRPRTACCTKAELHQIASNCATRYEATLRKRERREDVFVECKCPMPTLIRIRLFCGALAVIMVRRPSGRQRRNPHGDGREQRGTPFLRVGRPPRRPGGDVPSASPVRQCEGARSSLATVGVLHNHRI